jgi:hypothetical protein
MRKTKISKIDKGLKTVKMAIKKTLKKKPDKQPTPTAPPAKQAPKPAVKVEIPTTPAPDTSGRVVPGTMEWGNSLRRRRVLGDR